jgi:hypothetical protein
MLPRCAANHVYVIDGTKQSSCGERRLPFPENGSSHDRRQQVQACSRAGRKEAATLNAACAEGLERLVTLEKRRFHAMKSSR